MAENIVHLVLARVDGAPEGVKGISLFVVPKFLVKPTAAWGAQRRALRQHRAQDGHQGLAHRRAAVRRPWRRRGLPGRQENRGLEYMFIMMNARAYAWACRASRLPSAYQKAVSYARDRVQSRFRWTASARQRAHHPPPGRAPHADDDAGLTEAAVPWPRWRPPPTTPRTTTGRRGARERRLL